MTGSRQCVDCLAEGIATKRPIHPDAGPRKPRCATHHRGRRKRSQELAHARRLETGYALTAEQYQTLCAAQGGRCAICQRATGKTRRLAVDHDHKTGIVRGALCVTCNVIIMGRYDTDALQRAINYRSKPPAEAAIGVVIVPTAKQEDVEVHQHETAFTFSSEPPINICSCGKVLE